MNTVPVISIRRSAPFSPSTFLGAGWSVWRGPASGDGLAGTEEQEPQALKLQDVDFSKVLFEHTLTGNERWVKGDDKVARLRASGATMLDAAVAQALFEEKDNATLEWLRKERGITWFDLPGTVLRDADGYRYILGLYWNDGKWPWYPHWLENNWRSNRPSAVLR
ncbi:hypothetical protein EXS56_02305 [Candidatus Kaiserbacteria bacterium]|nr:hypothetical protein [Candidatus Kaiserbacteria bacterium]